MTQQDDMLIEARLVLSLYCCGCEKRIIPRLTNGAEIYPHRQDLHSLPFWKCDECKNFVGCHNKTKYRTNPLGCIPTPEIKNARKHLHALIDPIWQSGRIKRSALYRKISEHIGWNYHTAQIRTLDEARDVYRYVKERFCK